MNVALFHMFMTFMTFMTFIRPPLTGQPISLGNSCAPFAKKLPLEVHEVHGTFSFMGISRELVTFPYVHEVHEVHDGARNTPQGCWKNAAKT